MFSVDLTCPNLSFQGKFYFGRSHHIEWLTSYCQQKVKTFPKKINTWITKFDAKMFIQGQNVVPFMDSGSVHNLHSVHLKAVKIVYFGKNCTSVLKPLQNFKLTSALWGTKYWLIPSTVMKWIAQAWKDFSVLRTQVVAPAVVDLFHEKKSLFSERGNGRCYSVSSKSWRQREISWEGKRKRFECLGRCQWHLEKDQPFFRRGQRTSNNHFSGMKRLFQGQSI